MKNVKKIITALLIVLGLLIAAAPYTFEAVCPVGEKVMKCHWSARIELFLGIEIAVLAIIQLVINFKGFKSPDFVSGINSGISLALAANAAGVILVPSALIGVCKMAMMHCHSVTLPTLTVFGILVLVLSLIDFVISAKE